MFSAPTEDQQPLSGRAQRAERAAQVQALVQTPCPTHGTEFLGTLWKTEIATDVWIAETGKQKGPIAECPPAPCEQRAWPACWTLSAHR